MVAEQYEKLAPPKKKKKKRDCCILNLEDIADGRVTEDVATVSMVALRFHTLR